MRNSHSTRIYFKAFRLSLNSKTELKSRRNYSTQNIHFETLRNRFLNLDDGKQFKGNSIKNSTKNSINSYIIKNSTKNSINSYIIKNSAKNKKGPSLSMATGASATNRIVSDMKISKTCALTESDNVTKFIDDLSVAWDLGLLSVKETVDLLLLILESKRSFDWDKYWSTWIHIAAISKLNQDYTISALMGIKSLKYLRPGPIDHESIKSIFDHLQQRNLEASLYAESLNYLILFLLQNCCPPSSPLNVMTIADTFKSLSPLCRSHLVWSSLMKRLLETPDVHWNLITNMLNEMIIVDQYPLYTHHSTDDFLSGNNLLQALRDFYNTQKVPFQIHIETLSRIFDGGTIIQYSLYDALIVLLVHNNDYDGAFQVITYLCFTNEYRLPLPASIVFGIVVERLFKIGDNSKAIYLLHHCLALDLPLPTFSTRNLPQPPSEPKRTIKLGVKLYERLVIGLAYGHFFSLSKTLFSNAKQLGMVKSEYLYNGMIAAFLSRKSGGKSNDSVNRISQDFAASLHKQLIEEGYQTTPNNKCKLMEYYSKVGDVHSFNQLQAEIIASQPYNGTNLFRLLELGLTGLKTFEDALNYVEKCGKPHKVGMYNSLILWLFTKRPSDPSTFQQAETVLKLLKLHTRPDSITFRHFINAEMGRGNVEKAEAYVDEMKTSQISIPADVNYSLAVGYLKTGHVEKAITEFRQLCDGKYTKTKLIGEFLQLLVEMNRQEKVHDILYQLPIEKRNFIRRDDYTNVLVSLMECGYFDVAVFGIEIPPDLTTRFISKNYEILKKENIDVGPQSSRRLDEIIMYLKEQAVCIKKMDPYQAYSDPIIFSIIIQKNIVAGESIGTQDKIFLAVILLEMIRRIKGSRRFDIVHSGLENFFNSISGGSLLAEIDWKTIKDDLLIPLLPPQLEKPSEVVGSIAEFLGLAQKTKIVTDKEAAKEPLLISEQKAAGKKTYLMKKNRDFAYQEITNLLLSRQDLTMEHFKSIIYHNFDIDGIGLKPDKLLEIMSKNAIKPGIEFFGFWIAAQEKLESNLTSEILKLGQGTFSRKELLESSIISCCKAFDQNGAIRLLKVMESEGIQSSYFIYQRMVRMFLGKGDMKQSLDYFGKLLGFDFQKGVSFPIDDHMIPPKGCNMHELVLAVLERLAKYDRDPITSCHLIEGIYFESLNKQVAPYTVDIWKVVNFLLEKDQMWAIGLIPYLSNQYQTLYLDGILKRIQQKKFTFKTSDLEMFDEVLSQKCRALYDKTSKNPIPLQLRIYFSCMEMSRSKYQTSKISEIAQLVLIQFVGFQLARPCKTNLDFDDLLFQFLQKHIDACIPFRRWKKFPPPMKLTLDESCVSFTFMPPNIRPNTKLVVKAKPPQKLYSKVPAILPRPKDMLKMKPGALKLYPLTSVSTIVDSTLPAAGSVLWLYKYLHSKK